MLFVPISVIQVRFGVLVQVVLHTFLNAGITVYPLKLISSLGYILKLCNHPVPGQTFTLQVQYPLVIYHSWHYILTDIIYPFAYTHGLMDYYFIQHWIHNPFLLLLTLTLKQFQIQPKGSSVKLACVILIYFHDSLSSCCTMQQIVSGLYCSFPVLEIITISLISPGSF